MHKEHSHKDHSHRSKNKYEPIYFEAEKFGARFELVSHQIKVQYQLKSSLDFYDYNITEETIESSPELSVLYNSTESLFLDLKANYNQIIFTQDGVIIFEIAMQVLGKTSKKQIKFYMRKRESDSRIEELKGQISQIVAQHTRQMQLLRAQHAEEINELRREIAQIKSKMASFEEKSNNTANQGNYGFNFTTLGIYDDNNTNKKYFSVIKSESSIKVIKIVDSIVRNFALNLAIPKNSKNTIIFRQIKTKSSSIKYGIITKALITQSNTYVNKQSISLYGYNGHSCTATKESWDGKSIKDGCIISMTIDTFNWRLNWDVTGKSGLDAFSVSTYIPENMQAADLYVCLSIEDEKDEIDISLGQN